ncbi:hypothetical protein EDF68_1011009 [Ochrobactrum sp. BH3]|nr:hypothetical protein EDF68_1011009 [Ochrobactrum sp. BH3]
MTNPYPIPRSSRETDWLDGDGRATYGSFDFRIFDVEDIKVLVRRRSDGEIVIKTFSVQKQSDRDFDNFSITFDVPLDQSFEFKVLGHRLHERTSDLFRGGSIRSNEVEKEVSKQGVVLQEIRRDVDSESGARLDQLAGLNERIDQEIAERTAGDDANFRALQDEVAARIAGDAELHNQIDGIIPAVTGLTNRAEAAMKESEKSASNATALVEAASVGFTGSTDGIAYDYGWTKDPFTYFDRDYGRTEDPVIA